MSPWAGESRVYPDYTHCSSLHLLGVFGRDRLNAQFFYICSQDHTLVPPTHVATIFWLHMFPREHTCPAHPRSYHYLVTYVP